MLSLNPKKSYVLPIAKNSLDSMVFSPIKIDTNSLQFVSKIKNLGFYINSSLSCVDHINNVVKRVYLTLRNLRLSSDFTPISVKKKLVRSLIVPLFTYSEVVYSKLDSSSMHKLNVAMNNATRYVYGLKRYDHISNWKKEILGCDIEDYLKARNCIFMFKLLKNKTPFYLYEKINLSNSQRSRNLIIPSFNYLNSSRLFFVNTARLWNSLPNMLKNINSINVFKKEVQKFFT